MIDIKKEFQTHNFRLRYIDHRYLGTNHIGISYAFLHEGKLYNGVIIYKIVEGKIDWSGRAEMFDSWNDINQKER